MSIEAPRPPQMPRLVWQVQLLDAGGQLLNETGDSLSARTHFVTAVLPISAAWTSGRYQLRLVVDCQDNAQQRPGSAAFTMPLTMASVRNSLPVAGAPTQIEHAISALFGRAIVLDGNSALPAELQPGQTLLIALYWRARHGTRTNYTVFIHLVGSKINLASNNFLCGQVDQEPLDGGSRTSSWFGGRRSWTLIRFSRRRTLRPALVTWRWVYTVTATG